MNSIGDHIKAWRVQKELTQKEAAKLLFVSEDTIVIWENNKSTPRFYQLPAIIKVLGYVPWLIDTTTLGGKILQYRFIHGLSPGGFGRLVGADATTIRSWENGKRMPMKKKRRNIDKIISAKTVDLFTNNKIQ